MTQKLQAISGAILLLLLPVIGFADEHDVGVPPADGADVSTAVGNITEIANMLIPLFLTIAVVIFLWGVVKYIFKIGGEEGSKGGLKVMMWGIVAIFVMVSIWGLVALLKSTLDVDDPAATGATVANPDNLKVR